MFRCISWPARRATPAAAALAIAALMMPVASAAQQPPSRIGNVWDGIPHQPTQGDVSAAERERGVAAPAQHEQAVDSELQSLYNQLLSGEQGNPAPRNR